MIQPRLREAEMRRDFDIHLYGSRIIEEFGSAAPIGTQCSFIKIVHDQPKNEVARYFLATLQLVSLIKATSSISFWYAILLTIIGKRIQRGNSTSRCFNSRWSGTKTPISREASRTHGRFHLMNCQQNVWSYWSIREIRPYPRRWYPFDFLHLSIYLR